jgi:NDP-sugar pyrophosphorylase family protein
MKPILVLAGGFGSRLKVAISDVPKPLAPVCGKPFLIHLIEHLVSQGANNFVFLLHYEAELIRAIFNEVLNRHDMVGVTITSIVEDRPLGTGGAIINAINTLNINESFLVVNADTWLGDGLEQISRSSPNSIVAVKVKDCSRYGALVVKGTRVEKFLEKKLSHNSGLINAGLYHLSSDVFSEYAGNASFSLEAEVFPIAASNGILSAVVVDADFIDIGIPKDYYRFCNWIESGKKIDL